MYRGSASEITRHLVMAIKGRLTALAASLIFSAIAVWFILLNGRFASDGGPLVGYQPLIFVCICGIAAVVFAAVGAKAYKRRASLVAVAIVVGVVMPVAVIAAPMVFCLVFQCRGFDWP